MPADRRITVNVSAEGYRDNTGEYVPGAVTPIAVWASRRDVSQERVLERGGTRDETSRDWRIRWNALIAKTANSLLKVEDEGETFSIRNMVEVIEQRGGAPDLRHKFLDLTGIGSS